VTPTADLALFCRQGERSPKEIVKMGTESGYTRLSGTSADVGGNVLSANAGYLLKGDFLRMTQRRYQSPEPRKVGAWWYIRIRQDALENGQFVRKLKRIKLCPATKLLREAKKIADEILRPMNQGLITAGGAVTFNQYVEASYIPTVIPLLAKTTQDCYQGILEKHLKPVFGGMCLRDLKALELQSYFSGMVAKGIEHPTRVKGRDALSSVLRSAVRYGFLVRNELDGLQLPPDKSGRKQKPVLTPQQFELLLSSIAEPYATMIYVAVWTGLRVSEVIGLKWRCIHEEAESISIEERYCRGDWAHPKSQASAATIGVEPHVITRLQRLKTLSVEYRAGRAIRKVKAVRLNSPDDLVFQSVWKGRPMSDENILRRHIKPTARVLGLSFVNWRCLRTSHATWMVQAGADPKSVQAQMRHSRISTTMDIYAQVVPEAQRKALRQLSQFAGVVTLLSQKTGSKDGRNQSEVVTIQ